MDSKPKPEIAFAGLGAMGSGMCSQLLQNGFPVIAYDPYQPSLDLVVSKGARPARSPRDAATDVQFLICMVANHYQVDSLLFDSENGAVATLPKDAIIVICSTVAPAYISEVRKRLDDLGRKDIGIIDSPVSGGDIRAANGTLSIFASGEEEHLRAVKPILSCMSDEKKLYSVGGLGDGSKAKLIHQVFAGIHIAMGSEAMALAAKSGMNTRKAFIELNQGPGSSWVFGHRVPPMLDPSPRYSSMSIIAKDVGIITSSSRDFRFPLPLLSVCEQLYQQALSYGFAKEDDCALVRLFLPKDQGDLVMRRAKHDVESDESKISMDDIENLMIGVHLAAISEAMSFSEKLSIDTDLMYDIVINAAGASKILEREFESMKKAQWSLRGVTDIESIRDKLMKSVKRVSALQYPLFLSSAALQEYHRQLQ